MLQKQAALVLLAMTMALVVFVATGAPVADETHDHGADCGHHNDAPAATATGASTPEPRPKRQAPQAPSGGEQGGVMSFFSSLGPQVDQLKGISSIFSSSSSSSSSSPAASPASAQQSAMGLMSQLGDMVRSAQDSGNKLAQNQQQAALQTQQQAADAAQSSSSGFAAALSEIGQGLKRIATNNPSLVPEVKQLYTSVSQKLSSSSSSPNSNNPLDIQPATNSEQLADNLAKVMLKPSSA